MKLRIGFLGIGAMGMSHLKAMHLDHADRAEAVALCTRDPAKIKNALEVAPKAKVFESEHALINSELDAVFVAVPNFKHVPLALEVLSAGKHLFLEKPIGTTRAECGELIEAAAKTDRVVMIGHELRYSAYFRRIQSLVQEGAIGRPRMVWTREFRGPFQKKSQDWIEDARRSGGTLVDKNCHHFDLMNWWVGARPARVAAFGGCALNRVLDGPHQGIDHAAVSFEYANGVRGSLELCMFAYKFPNEALEMGIVGDAGVLQTCLSELTILHWPLGRALDEPIVHRVAATRGRGWGGHLGFAEIHHAFLQAVLEGAPHLTTVADCADGTLLAIAAEESIRTGQAVTI